MPHMSSMSRVKQESQKATGGWPRGPVKGPGSGPAKGRVRDTGAAGGRGTWPFTNDTPGCVPDRHFPCCLELTVWGARQTVDRAHSDKYSPVMLHIKWELAQRSERD